MKKLLIITTNFPPSTTIGTQRILRICKFLDRSRWQISVLTLKERYYPPLPRLMNGEGQAAHNDLKVCRTLKLDPIGFLLRLREKIRCWRSASQAPPRNAPAKPHSPASAAPSSNGRWQQLKDMLTDWWQFPDKQIAWLPFAVFQGYRMIRRENIDVIFSSTPPHSLHLSAVILKRLTGRKLIIDFRDPFARSPWHQSRRRASWLERLKHDLIISLEKWIVTHADQIILITKEMQDDFIREYPQCPPEKFHLFYNGYDPDQLASSAAPAVIPPRKNSGVIFVHAGSLYKRRNPTPVFQAIHGLLEQQTLPPGAFEFHFLGGVAPELQHVFPLIKSLNLTDIVKFIPRVSRQEAQDYMRQSDVLVLLQPVTRLQLPGKFYDYLCLGKPILAIAEKDSASETVIRDRFGLFADYRDISDIQKAITRFCQAPEQPIATFLSQRQMFDMSQSIRILDKILTE